MVVHKVVVQKDFDARESPSGHHKVPDSSELGRRSRFHLENYPRSYKERLGYLEVEEITLQDSGNYTCRVDFATSKTMMALLHLTVHQAIEDLNIYDENQTEISQEAGPYNQGTTVILSCVPTGEAIEDLNIYDENQTEISQEAGPYNQGTTVILSCVPTGGFPTPRVTWTSNGVVVARSSPTSRVAILKIPMIQREDNKRKFTCTASSTNLTKAVSEDVTISMNLPPLEVEIVGLEEPMTSGKERMLLCRSWGSQPAAYLDITADGPTKPIKFHQQVSSNLDSNVTLAKVRFLPVPEDDGKTLTCTATNPAVRSYKSSKTKTIVVHYAPEVHAQLALALDPKNIKEEDDAYIECKVKANPPPHKIIWYHNGVEVRANKEEGVILHAHDLVLQKVTRKQRGNYQCRAVNTINTTLSENVRLNIMYVPECKEPANVTHSVSPTEEVELSCEVDSYPEQVEFTWALNSTQSFTTLDEHRYQENGLRSTVRYKASNHDQYGVLFCWATNQLGRQTQPCLFIITPAGPPEALVSCSLANQSNTFLGVTCKPGHDGGLRQHFVAKVIDEITQNEVANVTSEVPEFELRGLAPGRDYLVVVTAVNAKGSSRPYILEGFALKVAENKINDTSSSDSSPLLAVFIGVVSGFVFILTILVFVTRAHCRRRPARSNADAEEEEEEKAKGVDKVLSHDELRSPGESSGEGGGEEPPPMAESPESTLQTEESPTTTRTYVPSASYGSLPHPTRPHQPLHSVGLPNVTSNNHKYYTLKINCTRQSNESFV
ncbi:uncharacterized protein LOC143033717 [Oratosquilla oratoria]|uniref:uncharacterized protein LOC143033717 n=1 Tax=Oratosquilla oratoria TaxID=337810 RepID=UPI003F773ECE